MGTEPCKETKDRDHVNKKVDRDNANTEVDRDNANADLDREENSEKSNSEVDLQGKNRRVEVKESTDLGKDAVMEKFHKNRESDFQRKRKENTSLAYDPDLPLTERFKAGGKALYCATKELEEGTKRERKARKLEKL